MKLISICFLTTVFFCLCLVPAYSQEGNDEEPSLEVIDETTFKATPGVLDLIKQYVPPEAYDSVALFITDSTLTNTQLTSLLDTLGVVPDSVNKIMAGMEVQMEVQRRLTVVTQIGEAIDALELTIREKKYERLRATTDEEKAALDIEIATLAGRLNSLGQDYNLALTGIDTVGFFAKEVEVKPIEEEMSEIFVPAIRSFKDLTGGTRLVAKINDDITYYETHIAQIRDGVERMSKMKHEITNPEAKERADDLLEFWEQQEKEFITKLNTAQQQLLDEEAKAKNRPSGFVTFLKGPGLNLFLALLALTAVLFAFQFLRGLIQRFSPLHKSEQHIFWANLIDLTFSILSVVFGVGTVVYIFFLLNDWILLGIVILIFLGALWSAKDSVAQYGKLIQLLLNQGEVRQNERVIYNGVPYRVAKISRYSFLVNPELAGGKIRLPIKDLIGLRSRIYDESEAWFPTSKGDWITVNGSFRQVISQTPEVVVLGNAVGTPEPMATKSFLGQKIVNLSKTKYWCGIMFSVSNKHRAIVESEIIPKIGASVKEAVTEKEWADQMGNPWITLWSVNGYGLDLHIGISVNPELANRYNAIKNILHQVASRLAYENGWEVPTTHVEVHKEISSNGAMHVPQEPAAN